MNVHVSRPDFAVLGGGLVGRLIAWRLAGDGHRVALYERGGPDGEQSAAWIAAAVPAPPPEAARSGEARVGDEAPRTCRSRSERAP
ncbi:FAD-dependent oxidoreductase, partial [Burkholderia sp. Tr-862]|uniref:FAD-dependent oxidoreductase n=1 Tax=Burkholderia sp. Tr-862 TaxID=2608331 RepID=UPI001FFD05E3